MPLAEHSCFLPPFLRPLADPSVKSIMLCGCGGGFDFVHSLLLYPELKRLGKSSAIEGWYGRDVVPPLVQGRAAEGELFLWPLMAVLWAFDVDCVARRSLIAKWIVECQSVRECTGAFLAARDELGDRLRPVENFPRHEDMRA
jgi:hypothetical protein